MNSFRVAFVNISTLSSCRIYLALENVGKYLLRIFTNLLVVYNTQETIIIYVSKI